MPGLSPRTPITGFLRTGIDSRIGIDDYDCLIHASMLRTGDVAIGISHSGSTKNTIKMLEEAKKNGATTICITGMEKAPITRVSDICMVSHSKETMFRSMAMVPASPRWRLSTLWWSRYPSNGLSGPSSI